MLCSKCGTQSADSNKFCPACGNPLESQAVPQVAPQPEPQAAPQVAPQPEPQAAPQVAPQPEPQSAPQVAPQPEPQSAPQVAPQPEPQSAPQVAPQPEPQVIPQPVPQYMPQPTPQPVPQYAPQSVQQYAPQYAPAAKNNENSFISKLRNDKLNLGLFITGILLALAVITMGVLMIISGGDSQKSEAKTPSRPKGVEGVWVYKDDYDDEYYNCMIFDEGGEGKMAMMMGNMMEARGFLWQESDGILSFDTSGEGYEESAKFVYSIEGKYMYLEGEYSDLLLYWISSDTSIAYSEMMSGFDKAEDEYFEKLEKLEEELYDDDDWYDDEYYDEDYDEDYYDDDYYDGDYYDDYVVSYSDTWSYDY